MTSRARRHSLLRTGIVFWLLAGAVMLPALLSLSVGIVALALWREALDIIIGVLVLCFAAMALTGATLAVLYVRRSARLAEMQSDFIANVSHELRTPLAGIRLLVETLALDRAPTPEQRTEVIDHLGAEVARLEDLVARILSWRRLESGAAVLHREPLEISEVVRDAVSAVVAAAVDDRPQIELDIATALPAVRGDREALFSALRNLVHNAVKFGADRGPVHVVVGSEGTRVTVAVRDHGPGIPYQDRHRIFERFYRAAAHARDRQGSGLGLAIARRVVEEHRGELLVDSETGVGSTFTVRLPALPSVSGGACEGSR